MLTTILVDVFDKNPGAVGILQVQIIQRHVTQILEIDESVRRNNPRTLCDLETIAGGGWVAAGININYSVRVVVLSRCTYGCRAACQLQRNVVSEDGIRCRG